MCGIFGWVGDWEEKKGRHATQSMRHRGPDSWGVATAPSTVFLGHCRLSIIDLSPAGHQPMLDAYGRYQLVFNGEIYNYQELYTELKPHYPFKSRSDSEVLLAAYHHWGEACLDRLLGMFAFAIWDSKAQRLFAARDRFGVKPFYYFQDGKTLIFASEIKALHRAGVPRVADATTWKNYLSQGVSDFWDRTFWLGIRPLPPGHFLSFCQEQLRVSQWYALDQRVADEIDSRAAHVVMAEYQDLLEESIRLRFRSDVEVGVSLSGGLDSSLLLGLIARGSKRHLHAFTFGCNDPDYDEWPFVEAALHPFGHQGHSCVLEAEQVPAFAFQMSSFQDEPYGGIPTLAYVRLFQNVRTAGIKVILDGQGMDEQWAGYDYYHNQSGALIQGTRRSIQPLWLKTDPVDKLEFPQPFKSHLRNLQFRDLFFTKLQRALRFNDRASMASSCELREPFLDHRLVELAMRQPDDRKIRNGTGKWLLRQIAEPYLPNGFAQIPKRPVQTPQREWLRGPLKNWVDECLSCLPKAQEWVGLSCLDFQQLDETWRRYLAGEGDNSFMVWQWISLALAFQVSNLPHADVSSDEPLFSPLDGQ